MKELRILFMGTPEFAVHILDEILKTRHKLVGVVTAPDKPAGRGQNLRPSAVKKFAVAQQLPVLQPSNLKAESFQHELENLKPDVCVVVAFRMLPQKVWNFPKLGTFNLHASLLPDYRGAAPINWAIINGEKQTGVTTFFLDEKIDTGNIIARETINITREDTAGSLHDKLMQLGAGLVVKTLDIIGDGAVNPKKQPGTDPEKPAPKLNPKNTKIDWKARPETIYNFVRGLNPYPVAWTILKNGKKELRCKIYAVEVENEAHDFPVGKVIKTNNQLKVAVEDGFVILKEMQLPGKKKMPVEQLLNGLHLREDTNMR